MRNALIYEWKGVRASPSGRPGFYALPREESRRMVKETMKTALDAIAAVRGLRAHPAPGHLAA